MAAERKNDASISEKEAHELLARDRERVETALSGLGRQRISELAEIDTETSADDDAETIVEEEVDDALARSLRSELEAIERAEKRLEDGTYGLSVESGEQIPAERLQTVPYAERTIEEQERYERTHGGAA